MHEFEFRSETHVVATRMDGYAKRDKAQAIIEKSLKRNNGKETLAAKVLIKNIKPRAVTCKITYQELKPNEDNNFEDPGVVLREVCLDDGRTLGEFRLSLDEAKKLAQLLGGLK